MGTNVHALSTATTTPAMRQGPV